MSRPRNSLGIDIGGTFTDFTLWIGAEQRFATLKVPTTRSRPAQGVVAGLERLAAEQAVSPQAIDHFVHGTTIALNTLIERDGARLGLLVTRGFRDLLIIQRLRMPTPYNWRTGRPAPLIARRHTFEVSERLGPGGEVDTPLAEDEVRAAAEAARAAELDGLVVCFLHAYTNPAHEVRARALIEEAAPGLYVCCSHETWPRMREYERATISVMNAFVAPKTAGYLADLEEKTRALGMATTPYITQSTGGIVSAASARRNPVEMLLSGPAAGVMGAVHAAAEVGVRDFITLDIGGTSADVAFVDGGRPRISQSEHIADFPLLMPVVGVSSIGAGGGSVVSADEHGVIHVGPASVGAEPGPACYGRGGRLPAVTDVFLLGGFLNPQTFAGGGLGLSVDAAAAAVAPLTGQVGRDLPGTIEAVIQVAVSAIYAEISNLAARQGVSPSDYALLPFGGAGPLLAVAVAEELGIDRVIVPAAPGTLCSLGALLADVAKPFIRSVAQPLDVADDELKAALADLKADADAWLAADAPALGERRFDVAADMRYVGQSYEIDVSLDPAWIEEGDSGAIAAAFHRRHRALFAHADETAPAEVVDLRLTIVGATDKPGLSKAVAPAAGPLVAAATRDVVVRGALQPVPIYLRAGLPADARIPGPAVIEQADTTTWVAPGWTALAHPSGTLLIERTRQ